MLSSIGSYVFGFGAIALLAIVSFMFTLFAMQQPAQFLLWFAIPIDIIYAGVILMVLHIMFGKQV